MILKPMIGRVFCTHYEKIWGSFCTNLHFAGESTEQWCYVSSSCTALKGGEAEGSVKWKVRTPGQDTLLGEMTPEHLHWVAMTEGNDAGLLLKMAYSMSRQGLNCASPRALRCVPT
mmetsp:Transcript_111216/g.325296  ORF Transcript_111216/g.325296 Transcript_111216/m.325296 type:complete len:116 (+) Transcript_111216:626-973(+)